MTKAVKSVKVVKSTSKFVANYLAKFDKTEVQLQTEKAEAFIEDSIIECQSVLAQLTTSDLPKELLVLKRTELQLEKATKAYNEIKFTIFSSFSTYIDARNCARIVEGKAKQDVSSVKGKIYEIETQIAEYTSVLEDLQATV